MLSAHWIGWFRLETAFASGAGSFTSVVNPNFPERIPRLFPDCIVARRRLRRYAPMGQPGTSIKLAPPDRAQTKAARLVA